MPVAMFRPWKLCEYSATHDDARCAKIAQLLLLRIINFSLHSRHLVPPTSLIRIRPAQDRHRSETALFARHRIASIAHEPRPQRLAQWLGLAYHTIGLPAGLCYLLIQQFVQAYIPSVLQRALQWLRFACDGKPHAQNEIGEYILRVLRNVDRRL